MFQRCAVLQYWAGLRDSVMKGIHYRRPGEVRGVLQACVVLKYQAFRTGHDTGCNRYCVTWGHTCMMECEREESSLTPVLPVLRARLA